MERRNTPPVCTDVTCACINNELAIAFLQRPIVTQISRWDRLKGWVPLVQAWVYLKVHAKEFAEKQDGHLLTPAERNRHDPKLHKKMLRNSCLVLAGLTLPPFKMTRKDWRCYKSFGKCTTACQLGSNGTLK
jgi:hypothetical protein